VYWTFVFRSQFMAETVRLETITNDEAEARALAAKHLESVNRPPTAFVSLRPACVARTVDHPDLVEKYAPELLSKPAADDNQPAVH
jgi:hypothetical protein